MHSTHFSYLAIHLDITLHTMVGSLNYHSSHRHTHTHTHSLVVLWYHRGIPNSGVPGSRPEEDVGVTVDALPYLQWYDWEITKSDNYIPEVTMVSNNTG